MTERLTDREWRLTEGTAKVWSFRWKPYNWAIYTINDDTGEFTIQSDWGDYTYRWHVDALGPSRNGQGKATLTEFLAYAGADYIVNKLGHEKQRSFRRTLDIEGTRRSLREVILETRRTEDIGKKDARALWTELDEALINVGDECCNDQQYVALRDLLVDDTWGRRLVYGERLIECPWEYFVDKPSSRYIFCRDELIPFFQGHLRSQEVSDAA